CRTPYDYADLSNLLRVIGDTGDYAAIQALATVLCDTPNELEDAAEYCCDRLVPLIPSHAIAGVDAACREPLEYEYCYPSQRRGLDTFLGMITRRRVGKNRLCVWACASDGHRRQAAVQDLDALNDWSVFPFLLVRLNDWVEPVRRAATDAVFKRVRS